MLGTQNDKRRVTVLDNSKLMDGQQTTRQLETPVENIDTSMIFPLFQHPQKNPQWVLFYLARHVVATHI